MVWGLGFRVQGSLGSGYLESVQESALNPKPQLSSFCFCEASSVSLCTESHKPCKNGCAPSLEPLGIQSLWAAWCLRRPTGDPGPTAAVLRSSTLCTSSLISHVTGVPRLQTGGCAACTGVPKPSPAAARASSRAAQPLPKRRARCTPVSSGKCEAAACRDVATHTSSSQPSFSTPVFRCSRPSLSCWHMAFEFSSSFIL